MPDKDHINSPEEGRGNPLVLGDDEHTENLIAHFSQLQRFEERLRFIGDFITMLTFFHLAVLVMSFVPAFTRALLLAVGTVSLAILFNVLTLVFLFQRREAAATDIFEEVVDELQWVSGSSVVTTSITPSSGNETKSQSVGYSKSKSGSSAKVTRLTLDGRLAIRKFLRAKDLPLIPGRYGPAIYAAVNSVIFILVAVNLRDVFFRF